MILGMVQTPYTLNVSAKAFPESDDYNFYLSVDTTGGNTPNSFKIGKFLIEDFVELSDMFEWDIGPFQYNSAFDVEECEEKYDDVRVESACSTMEGFEGQIDFLSRWDTDETSASSKSFDPPCSICGEEIENQVYEFKLNNNNPLRDTVGNSNSSHMYLHKECSSYLFSAIIECLTRFDTEIIASQI